MNRIHLNTEGTKKTTLEGITTEINKMQEKINKITTKMNKYKNKYNELEDKRQELKNQINRLNIWKININKPLNNNSSEEESSSEPETVVENITNQESHKEKIDYEIREEETKEEDNMEMIDFSKHEYSKEKEKEVFLGKLRWRCDRRKKLEENVEERRLQEEEWTRLREDNKIEIENYLKSQQQK
ncbi:probable E3 ubiquitin-protein ligase bre1 [Leptopilina heterotoma]|uniref:probable E3 ubiquitin-protein ligase bre1 n=1 Tax=Leptopilina heterotoma TaxID=63436 RepID=UPI001CA82732|nr:probable E3 ubiquitin-protein ligase bre1 [Leptopilina heterotoma]XP_043475823.1 probable E3 ubiquitin-protein ligase bre1 [Leptopilina heterotoma]